MISSENLSFLLGVLVFCGETIIPKGTRGSQLSFKFTIRYFRKGGKCMKSTVKRFLVFGFLIVFSICCILNVSAANSVVTSADFSDNRTFVALGDLNHNNIYDITDFIILKRIILGTSAQIDKYSDVNEDGLIDITDLVHLKRYATSTNIPVEISNNALTLNGKAYFTGDFVSLLRANTEYQISYNVTSKNGISITVSGATTNNIIYNSGKAVNGKYFSHILKTGDSLSANKGFELSIAGNGTIKNFVIVEILDGWNDGDSLEQGKNDIF